MTDTPRKKFDEVIANYNSIENSPFDLTSKRIITTANTVGTSTYASSGTFPIDYSYYPITGFASGNEFQLEREAFGKSVFYNLSEKDHPKRVCFHKPQTGFRDGRFPDCEDCQKLDREYERMKKEQSERTARIEKIKNYKVWDCYHMMAEDSEKIIHQFCHKCSCKHQ